MPLVLNRTPRAVGPMSPDTLNPIGLAIIHHQGWSPTLGVSCGTGALPGPLGQKSILAVQLWGEPAPFGGLPPTPPFYIRCLSSDVEGVRLGVEGAKPPCSTAGPKGRGATLRETFGFT